MRLVVRIATTALLVNLVACDDFLGIGDSGDVDVIAEVSQDDNRISLTIENRGSDTIYFHSAHLERREDGEWRSEPSGVAYIDILLVLPIGPGKDHSVGRPIVVDPAAPFPRPIPLTLSSGAYRYKVSMTTKRNTDSSDMPGETRTSNTVRIE